MGSISQELQSSRI